MTSVLREHLLELQRVLEQSGESALARLVAPACAGPESQLQQFLESNELWGGAGSIADQAGGTREVGRAIEAALIQLGEAQVAAKVVNSRTKMWVETFREWERRAI